ILKDRLWFFLGGRKIPTADTTSQTVLSRENYVTQRDEDRGQIKLTGNVNPDHVISASYLKYDAKVTDGAGLPAADLRALATRKDPRNIYTLQYQGVLSENTFLNVEGTRKRVSIENGGDPSKGSPFLDF